MLTPANGRNAQAQRAARDDARARAGARHARRRARRDHSQTVGRYCELIASGDGTRRHHGRARAARGAAARRRQHRDLEHAAEQARAARARRSGPRSAATPRSARASSRTRGSATSANGSSRTTSASTARASRSASRTASIPLEARILAVADAFEAMTSERPHRAALTRRSRRWRSCSATRARSSTPTWSMRCCERWSCVRSSRLTRRVTASSRSCSAARESASPPFPVGPGTASSSSRVAPRNRSGEPKWRRSVRLRAGPMPGSSSSTDFFIDCDAPLAVVLDREPVRLVADALQQLQRARVARQDDRPRAARHDISPPAASPGSRPRRPPP